MILERHEDENYINFMKRVVSGVKNGDIDYKEMGDLLLEDGNCYSSDNSRKAYYFLRKICDKIEGEYNYFVGKRILSISDLHVPFQLPIETFINYKGNIDILVINGDATDLSQISKFRGVRRNSPMEDIIETRKYLIDLISYINPKEVYATFGNHDIRFVNYLLKSIDTDLCELLPKTQLDLIFDLGFHHHNYQERTKVWYEPLTVVFPNKE